DGGGTGASAPGHRDSRTHHGAQPFASAAGAARYPADRHHARTRRSNVRLYPADQDLSAAVRDARVARNPALAQAQRIGSRARLAARTAGAADPAAVTCDGERTGFAAGTIVPRRRRPAFLEISMRAYEIVAGSSTTPWLARSVPPPWADKWP